MTEQLRKEFEAWACSHYYLQELSFEREAGGDYSDPEMGVAWEAWQAAKTEPERGVEPWIPVSEGLPEGNGSVEFYSDDLRNPTCHVIGYYKGGKWFFAGNEFVNVTHWKPATAAPKEQSDE